MYLIENLKEKISFVLTRKGIEWKDFATDIGMTPGGLHTAMQKNDTKFSTIVAMANVLGVDLEYFVVKGDEVQNIVSEEKAKYLTIYEQLKECKDNNHFLVTQLNYVTKERDELKKNSPNAVASR